MAGEDLAFQIVVLFFFLSEYHQEATLSFRALFSFLFLVTKARRGATSPFNSLFFFSFFLLYYWCHKSGYTRCRSAHSTRCSLSFFLLLVTKTCQEMTTTSYLLFFVCRIKLRRAVDEYEIKNEIEKRPISIFMS